jgi:hypothetical protein
MQEHVLDDGIGSSAMQHDLVEIVFNQASQFNDFRANRPV